MCDNISLPECKKKTPNMKTSNIPVFCHCLAQCLPIYCLESKRLNYRLEINV